MMNDEQRNALRERNQRRAYACPKCGSGSTKYQDGKRCGGFPGIAYLVCGACGHADPRPKHKLPAETK